MPMTDKQKTVLDSIHKAFGAQVRSARIVSSSRKIMHVKVESDAGLWEYMIRPDGNIDRVMFTQRMFNNTEG